MPNPFTPEMTLNDKLAMAGVIAYTSSRYFNVSSELGDYIASSESLRDELTFNRCTLDLINKLCYKDQQFGGFVYDQTLVSLTLEQMRGQDASDLYNKVEKVEHEETGVLVDVPASPDDCWGKVVLGFISLFFDNRIELIGMSLAFLKILFKHLTESDWNLWVKHCSEFTRHFAALEANMTAFTRDFPTSAPDVGDFRFHSAKLGEYILEMDLFGKYSVGPAYDKVKDATPNIALESAEMPLEEAPMAPAAAGVGSGLGENEDRKGKRKMG